MSSFQLEVGFAWKLRWVWRDKYWNKFNFIDRLVWSRNYPCFHLAKSLAFGHINLLKGERLWWKALTWKFSVRIRMVWLVWWPLIIVFLASIFQFRKAIHTSFINAPFLNISIKLIDCRKECQVWIRRYDTTLTQTEWRQFHTLHSYKQSISLFEMFKNVALVDFHCILNQVLNLRKYHGPWIIVKMIIEHVTLLNSRKMTVKILWSVEYPRQ